MRQIIIKSGETKEGFTNNSDRDVLVMLWPPSEQHFYTDKGKLEFVSIGEKEAGE